MSSRVFVLNAYLLIGLLFLLVVSAMRLTINTYENRQLTQLLADDIKLNVELAFQTGAIITYELPVFNVPYEVTFKGDLLRVKSKTGLNWSGIIPTLTSQEIMRTLKVNVHCKKVFKPSMVMKILPVAGGVKIE